MGANNTPIHTHFNATIREDVVRHYFDKLEDDNLFRISIAGAQEKTALLRWKGKWYLPHGATPTTHIIKLPLGLIGGSRRVDAGDPAFFLITQLAFFLLAATDGHAKNYSIYLHPGDRYEMTPLYDILSMWPHYGDANNQFKRRKAGLAMAIRSKNAHYLFYTIEARHWHALAMKNGGPGVWNAMLGLAGRVEAALADVEGQLPADFPVRTWDRIAAGMREETRRFLAGRRRCVRYVDYGLTAYPPYHVCQATNDR
jgi:serine/threonine protein kinase HipA of HipAB toxin-antitoxin module